jgi:CheY-like chemotaxis protein
LEAANLDEAIRGMEQQAANVVLAALDLPPSGAASLCTAMRARLGLQQIPVLALADSAAQAKSAAAQALVFHGCQDKFDREALLESVARLASAHAASEPATAFAEAELACMAGESNQ